jgi:hypothetical protein
VPPTSVTDPSPAGPAFTWQDYGRFVQAGPVEQGWLVFWGHHRDQGLTRVVAGNRTYVELEGARRRVADAVLELTRDEALVAEALVRFDRTRFSNRVSPVRRDPR